MQLSCVTKRDVKANSMTLAFLVRRLSLSAYVGSGLGSEGQIAWPVLGQTMPSRLSPRVNQSVWRLVQSFQGHSSELAADYEAFDECRRRRKLNMFSALLVRQQGFGSQALNLGRRKLHHSCARGYLERDTPQ
jgi:hypothetical protein